MPPGVEETIAYIISLPPPPYVPPKEYVYLTKSDFGYKIGRTTRPDQRPLIVAGNMPIQLEVIVVVEVENSRESEKQLHSRFEDKRLRGEWFSLDAADVEVVKGFPESLKNLPLEDDDDIPF